MTELTSNDYMCLGIEIGKAKTLCNDIKEKSRTTSREYRIANQIELRLTNIFGLLWKTGNKNELK